MDSIKEKLCQWADHNKGSFKTTCTLSLKSDGMDINIEADSLEEAYNKLESIVEQKNSEPESKEEVVIPEKEAAQPAPIPAPAVESANYNASNILKNNDVEKILSGRTLLRIYSAGTPLAPNEELVTIGALTYVVKK